MKVISRISRQFEGILTHLGKKRRVLTKKNMFERKRQIWTIKIAPRFFSTIIGKKITMGIPGGLTTGEARRRRRGPSGG